MLSVMAVSVSRVMLSIHSLASHLNSADVWLLNHGELSRVQWKKGSRAGELLVDVNVAEPEEMELSSIVTDAVKTTQVGVYNDAATSPLSPGPTWSRLLPKQCMLCSRTYGCHPNGIPISSPILTEYEPTIISLLYSQCATPLYSSNFYIIMSSNYVERVPCISAVLVGRSHFVIRGIFKLSAE
jgi:hypothetical protein